MENRVVFSRAVFSSELREAAEALAASAAALAASMGAGPSGLPAGGLPDGRSKGGSPEDGSDPLEGGGPLRDLADACLERLADLSRMEAPSAALKDLGDAARRGSGQPRDPDNSG
jgi:hypothetical protein